MAVLVQGVAVLLVATLLPFGGLAEDIGLIGPQPIDADPSLDATPAVTAEASLDLTQASVQTDAVSLQAQDGSISATVGEAKLGIDAGALSPSQLGLLLGAGQAGDGTVAPGSTSPAPASSAAQAVDPADALPGLLGSLATAQAASAAALAAVAVIHAEPAFWDARRLVTRVSPFLASMYSRISREDVLDHDTRAQAYELLRESPGLSLGEIAERLGAARSTVRHHVRKLEEAGMVRHETRGRCRIHFPVGREREAVAQHTLRHPQRAKITEILETRPLSLVELSAVMDANVGAVHFHLKKLREAGLVERYENGSVKYRPAQPA